MSITSDAVWIVKELMDEILGMVHLEKFKEVMDGRITDVKSEVMEEHDWVKQIEAEEQEMIGKKMAMKSVDKDETPVECDFCFDECICEEIDEEMKEVIGDVKSGNRKDIVVEKKEEKFPMYKTMGFNWKEVDPIFKGDFRYVYIELIDGFSAGNSAMTDLVMKKEFICDKLRLILF